MLCPKCGVDLGEGMLPARCPACGHNLSDTSSEAEGARRAAERKQDVRGLVNMPGRNSGFNLALRALFALVLVAAFVGIIAFVLWHLEIFGGSTVPDVMGWRLDRATEELERDGFNVTSVTAKDDGIPGLVIGIDPAAGKRIEEGASIELTISEERKMPEIVGKPRDEAAELLDAEGLEAEYEDEISDEEEGTIIWAGYEAGRVLTSADVVQVRVAKPRVVPDVLGKSESEAKVALRDAGLTAKVSYVRAEDEKKAGTVVELSPSQGARVHEGDEVQVRIARGTNAELEKVANQIFEELYGRNAVSAPEKIGAALRTYLDPDRKIGGKSVSSASDAAIFNEVVGNVKLPDDLKDIAGKLKCSLVGVDDVTADGNVVTARVTIKWDWSPLGDDYDGVTSKDTHDVKITFDDNQHLVSISDADLGIPEYEIEEGES